MAIFQTRRPATGADGAQTIGVDDARGAQRVGLIWMLVISTALAALLLLGLWAFNFRDLAASQNRVDARTAASAPQSNAPTPPSANVVP